MGLKGIMSIAGMSGLYKLVSQTKSGFVIESLTDKKRTVVNSNQRISMLEDISVYTTKDDMPLKEIYKAIKEKYDGDLPVNPKSGHNELKNFLKSVLPDFDQERVYPSDIKKMVVWYPFVKDILAEETERPDKEGIEVIEKEKDTPL